MRRLWVCLWLFLAAETAWAAPCITATTACTGWITVGEARRAPSSTGAQHKTIVVPACGHNARCMFTADAVLSLIFPKE